jgi:hypothetical protein
MDADRLLVSLPPEKLELAEQLDVSVELKFDWEHRSLLLGDRDLGSTLDVTDIAPDRIRSIHLPPGIETHGDKVGMAITEANRGVITDFVYKQLDATPAAYLTAHPPKKFEYVDQLQLIAELLELTDRSLAIENLPADCRWHTSEALAFFAHAGREYDRLSAFCLTIDSAHLPSSPAGTSLRELDETWGEEIETGLAAEGRSLPSAFRTDTEQRLADRANRYLPDVFLSDLDESQTSRWTSFAQVIFMTADRVRSVHLNDPANDSIPVLDSHDDSPCSGALSGVCLTTTRT